MGEKKPPQWTVALVELSLIFSWWAILLKYLGEKKPPQWTVEFVVSRMQKVTGLG